MKIKRIRTLLLVPAFCLAALLPLSAQSYVETDKGYWQVHTDPNSRNTVVQFFDGSNHLLYQESMPRKYIKLTKRNVRLFDELLGKLMARELLSEKVKAYDLVADSRTDFRSVAVPESHLPASEVNLKTAMSNVYVVQNGKMKVILKNPTQEAYDIRIIDTDLRTIYYEKTSDPTYGRWFDMSKLAQGAYNVHISSPRRKLNYKLVVDDYLGYRIENLK
ncbi:hypothetical protein GCM10010967_14560 [Dyadobacter beijingensis]|uniref:DUF3244 domain-containing protein n=1 Tax=Dyadobacter beijingensis TaxID=365489 RepID=A0ABQ2HNI3_9BACT|nr:hypothetical protein [Dyadobacter beijingensis]GGM83819.1 hypothetical protein GCM10010967_14560 [Dyadobacter beijingensis]